MLKICIFFSILICLFGSAFVENFASSIWIAFVIERDFLILNFGRGPSCDWKIDDDDAIDDENMTRLAASGRVSAPDPRVG